MKKRRYHPLAGSKSKTFARSSLVGPEAVLAARGHVVRDDVEHHAEPGARELAERLLAAELLRDPRRVDDVVAVRRAGLRLHDRREVEVRDAELGQVRDELARLAEAEPRPQLQAVRGVERRAHQPRRSTMIERDSTGTPTRAVYERAPSATSGSAVESSNCQRAPNRFVGSLNSIGS